jgi:ATP/maltotriose-dependent transcriptional regulator MalT
MAHYETALACLDSSDERRGELVLALGDAALVCGDHRAACAAYERAQEWYAHHEDRTAVARIARGLASALWHRNQLAEARDVIHRALDCLGPTPSEPRAQLLISLANMGFLSGEADESLRSAQEAREIAIRLNDPELQARAAAVLGIDLRKPAQAIQQNIELLEQAMAFAACVEAAPEWIESATYLATFRYWNAEVDAARELTARNIETVGHWDWPTGLNAFVLRDLRGWLGFVLTHQGEWAESEALLRARELVDDSVQSLRSERMGTFGRGIIALLRQDYRSAERELTPVTTGPDQRDVRLYFNADGPLAIAKAGLGKYAEARALAQRLEELLTGLDPDWIIAGAVTNALCLVSVMLRDYEAVERLYDRCSAFAGLLYYTLVDRTLGLMALALRRFDAASAHLARAERTARTQHLRPELAAILCGQADLELQRRGVGARTQARKLLQEALELYEALDMQSAATAIRGRLGTRANRTESDLSMREMEVAELVRRGHSNRQIGEALCITSGTANLHVKHILSKLEFRSRSQIASWMSERAPLEALAAR